MKLPLEIKKDMEKFLDHLEANEKIDIKAFGIKNIRFEELVNNLRKIYL